MHLAGFIAVATLISSVFASASHHTATGKDEPVVNSISENPFSGVPLRFFVFDSKLKLNIQGHFVKVLNKRSDDRVVSKYLNIPKPDLTRPDGGIYRGALLMCETDRLSKSKDCLMWMSRTKKWKKVPSLHEYHKQGSAAILSFRGGESLWFIAGLNVKYTFKFRNSSPTVEYFQNGTWNKAVRLPRSNFGHAAAQLSDHEIMVCGGNLMDHTYDYVDKCYGLDVDDQKSGWKKMPKMPSNRGNFGMAGMVDQNGKRKIVAFGGITGNTFKKRPLKAVDVFDVASNTWNRIDEFKYSFQPTSLALAEVKSIRGYLFGISTNGDKSSGNYDVVAFDEANKKWLVIEKDAMSCSNQCQVLIT